uniref:MuHD domain-containing protein n=1 Tax=Mesocestoides corti TaxID=53468 RepID=A0A5K3EVQ3_MESCO
MSGGTMFSHTFWGDKNLGFDTLIQNMKLDVKNTNEFCDFLREMNAIEENYAKALGKLSKQASSFSTAGSFKLCWSLLASFFEKMVSLRSGFESDRLNLWKDVQKYLDELQKKQRILKDSEATTQEVVHSFQVATTHLQKAKELYHSRYKDYERVRLNETHSTRDIEKAETKLKKAQDEYKYSVEKYNNLRVQFVDKMRVSCDHFEQMEYAHLVRMCEFLTRLGENVSKAHSAFVVLASDFNQRRVTELTPDNLLMSLVAERGTGNQEPLPAEFEDVEVAAAFHNANEGDSDNAQLKRTPFGSTAMAAPSSTPGPLHLTLGTNNLRAASALPAFGPLGSQESPMTNHRGPLEPGWQSSLSEINASHSTGLSWRAGNIFQRRNRQNSSGLDVDTASVNSAGSGFNGGPGTFAQRLANVRNRARLPRKTSNSPSNDTLKAPVAAGVDEEGYNIRPENPWETGRSKSPSSSSEDGSDVVSSSDKTFRGIKVNIRPLGDLAPAVAAAPNCTDIVLSTPMSSRTPHDRTITGGRGLSLSVRDSRRPHTSVDKPFGGVDVGPTCRSNSVSTNPIVPVLPPPPGQGTLSNRRARPHPTVSAKTDMAVSQRDAAPFNPFGLPHRDDDQSTADDSVASESTPTPRPASPAAAAATTWEAFFAPSDTNETYDRLIDLRDDVERVTEAPETPLVSKVCQAPIAVLDDDDDAPSEVSPAPISPSMASTTSPVAQDTPRTLPQPPHHFLPPPPPPPPPPPSQPITWSLPIAIALTETWRAQFPNGGGSSFSTMERPEQSLFGQVTLAVAREDLRQLTEFRLAVANAAATSATTTTTAALNPLILVFSRASRMKNMQATFAGVTVKCEKVEGETAAEDEYRVTIPGDLLYHYLVATHSAVAQTDTEAYTRLSLLDYTVELAGLRPPVTMCTYWRCEKATTDFRLDYFIQWPKLSSVNGDAVATETSCQDLRVNLMVDGGVVRMQSHPLGTWNADLARASWSIPIASMSTPGHQRLHQPGVDLSGNIRAKFFLAEGPGTPQPVALQFCRDGGPLPSGATFALGVDSDAGGGGYRLTMCKYRLLGDRYFCDPPVGCSAVALGQAETLSPLRPKALPPSPSN